MDRERRVIDTFVQLTDTLVEDFDADELLHLLGERCVELLGVDAAGVMLAIKPDHLRAVAGTGPEMHQLEIFEVASREGPSYDAFAGSRPVIVDDISGAEQRWPHFTPRALDLGFRSAYGFPLRLRDRTMGALNLFQVEGRPPLDASDHRLAQGFADVAAIGLVQERLLHHAGEQVDQLTYALDARVLVEQAKGMIAERLGLSGSEAFERLRSHARSHNVKVRDVAGDIVDGRLDLA